MHDFITLKTGIIATFLFFLQVQPENFDILTISKDLSPSAILLFISYFLNKKMDKMADSWKVEEKEIRKGYEDKIAMLEQKLYDCIGKR